MKLKLLNLIKFLHFEFWSYLTRLSFVFILVACVPTGPGGGDLEIETAESTDPELVNSPAFGLAWGEESVESSVSYANRAKALWQPSNDAPFFARQKIRFFTDTSCQVPMGPWRSVQAGHNHFWVDGLSHLSTVSFRIQTYTDFNDILSACSDSISVNLTTQKDPVITSTCSTALAQNQKLTCQVTSTDLNLQTISYSISGNTCGASTLSINSTSGLLEWQTDDDDFSSTSCSANIVATDTDGRTDTQALNFSLTNIAPTLSIASQSILENSGAQILLTDAEVQASDEGFGVYSISSNTCDPALGTLSGINTTTGEVSFTPTANLHGTCEIVIGFDDQNSANNTVSTTVSVNLVSTNQTPTLSENCATSKNEGEAYSCQITSTDGDAADVLTYALSAANTCTWAVVNSSTGAVTTSGGVPLTDMMVGACTLGLQVTDGNDVVTTQKAVTVNNSIPTLSISNEVSVGNIQPYSEVLIKSDAQIQANEEPYGTYSIVASDNSPDCRAASISVSLSIHPSTGAINFRPQETIAAAVGTSCFIKVNYADTNGASVATQFLLNWNVNNSPSTIIEPIINTSCEPTESQNATHTCELHIDMETNLDDDPVTWELAPGHTCSWVGTDDFATSEVVAMPNNFDKLVITNTPNDDDVGTCTIAIRAWDHMDGGVKNYSNIFSRSVTINNVTPSFNSFTTEFTIAEDAGYTVLLTDAQLQVDEEGYGTYDLLPPDSGINCLDPDPGTAGLESGGLAIDSSTGKLELFLASDYSDDCGFKIQFNDGNGGVIEQPITIDFTEEADAPVISASCPTSINEDDGTLINTYSCTINLDDPDFEDTFTWNIIGTNNNPTCSWLSFPNRSVNVISGVPEDDNVGTCDVKIYVTDSYGLHSNFLEWTVVVNNQVPTIMPNPLPSEPQTGSFLEDSGSILVKSDAQIQSLDEGFGTYSLDLDSVSGPGCHEFGSLEIDQLTGAIRFQPATNWAGNCNIRAQFDDENPTSNTHSSEFNVTVTQVQDSPTINVSHCPRTLLQDTSYICEPKLFDPDVGDTVQVNVVTNTCSDIFEKTGAIGDELIENKAGRPNDNDISSCTLVLEAVDNHGNKSATTNLSITIANQAPTINLFATDGSSPINLDTIAVYEDANDIDGSTGTTLDDAILLTGAQVQSVDEGFGKYSLASSSKSPSCLDIFETNKLIIDEDSGQVIAIPPPNYNGECFLRINFNDFNVPNGVAYRVISVKVYEISDPAQITNDCPITITQDIPYSCDFDFTTIEPLEFHTFEMASDNTCSWAKIDAVSGTISGTPRNQDYNGGTCTLSVDIKDGRFAPAVNQQVIVSITNEAPEFTAPISDTTIYEDSDSTIIQRHQVISTDEEGEGGTYSIIASVTSPDCQTHSETLTIDPVNGEINMKPTTNYYGDCYINVQFDDGNATAESLINDEFKVTVTPLTDELVITSDCPDSITENSDYACAATASDPDNAPSITWNLVSGHTCSWMKINAGTGDITSSPEPPRNNHVGECTIAYQATDGIRYSAIKREVVTVNNLAPSFPALGTIAVSENAVNHLAHDFTINDSQEGFGQYSITPTTPSCADESSVTIDPNTGELYITPSTSVSIGTCNLTIKFDDFNLPNNTAEQIITIDIQADDDPPELSTVTASPCGSSATEDATYTCTLNLKDEEITNPQIGTGGSATHDFILQGTHNCGDLTFDTPVLSGTNENEITFSFTPTNVQSNLRFCIVSFKVRELPAGASSGTFEKTIKIQNQRPTFTHPNPLGTRVFNEQDGPYTIFTDGNLGVDNAAALETDDEAEEKAAIPGVILEHRGFYSLSTIGSNRCGEGAAGGSVLIDEDSGAITFAPSGNFTGTCNLYIVYNDGTEIENTVELTVPVQINPTPDPPVITGNTCTTSAVEKNPYECTFSFSDPDVGEPISWSLRADAGDCTFLEINPETGAVSGTLDDIEKNNLGASCKLVAIVNDGTTSTSSDEITIALSAATPIFTTLPLETDIAFSTTATEIFSDYDIQTDEEYLGNGLYEIVTAKIQASGADCDSGTGFNIDSFNTLTGAMSVTTGSTLLTCQIQIKYTDSNARSVTRTIDVRNRDIATFTTIDTACPSGPITIDQYVPLVGCDRSTITLTPVPTPAYDFSTDFQVDEAQTDCPLLARDGHGLDFTNAAIEGSFKNLAPKTCDLVYFIELPDGRKTPRAKISYQIDNVIPTFTGDATVAAVNEDDSNVVILSDASIQFNEEENLSGYVHRYTIEAAASDDCQDNGILLIDDETGQVTFTPAQDYHGTCNVKVRFNDGYPDAPLTVDVDRAVVVTSVNDNPNIPGGPNNNISCRVNILEGNNYTCTLPHRDPDTGDTIHWTTDPGTHTCSWLSINLTSGEITGTPTNSDVGTCVASFEVTDNVPDASVDDTTTYTITVVNSSPEILITVVNSITEDGGDQVVIPDANITVDGEGGSGTYALNSSKAQFPRCDDHGTLSINATNGQISFNPAQDFDGDCFGYVEFDDGNSAEPSNAEFFVTVNGINDAPGISTSCERNITQGDRFICVIRGLNPEEEEELSYSLIEDCGWLKLHYSGVIYGIPKQEDVGTCEAQIQVSDQTFDTTDTIYISVANSAPTLGVITKEMVYSTGTMNVATDNEIQASEEGETGTSYFFDHGLETAPRCYDFADDMVIDANTGAVTFEITEDKDVAYCNLGIKFTDGIEEAQTVMRINFNSNLDHVPQTSSSCLPSIAEGQQYVCYPSSEARDFDGIEWHLHPSHSCSWLSINEHSGFIQGVPGNTDVGTCTLAFYSEDNGINSALVQYDVTVTNPLPQFNLPNGGVRTIRGQTAGIGLFSDTDVQAPGEGTGFYFLKPTPTANIGCRLHGELILDSVSGATVIAPNKFYNDTCFFDLNFFDLNTASSTISKLVSVTVDGTNTQPVLDASCTPTAAVGTPYTCTISGSDLEGDTLTYLFSDKNTCNGWLDIDSATGEITGTPAVTDIGTCKLGVFVQDSTIQSSYYEVDITIPNVAGTFSGTFTKTIEEDAAFEVVFAGTDIEHSKEGVSNARGTEGKYFWAPANPLDSSSDCRSRGPYLLNVDTGEIKFKPPRDSVSSCNFKIGFDDLGSTDNIQYQILTVNINGNDDPPAITSVCPNTVQQDTNYFCSNSYDDVDSTTTATWSKTIRDTCDWLTLGASGILSGTPDNNDVGTCFLSLTVTLDGNVSLPYEEILTITDTVSSFTLDDRTLNEDTSDTRIYSDGAVNAQEEGKGSYYLSDEVTSGDQCSSYGTLTIDPATGETHFSPAANKNGTCYVRIGFQENNGPGNRFETEGKVTITPTNDSPELNYYCNTRVNQDSLFTCQADFYDPDGDSATSFQFLDNSCSWLSINNETGELSGTPRSNNISACSARIRSSDGLLYTNQVTISIDVINAPPQLTIQDTQIIKNSGFVVLRTDEDVQATEEGHGVYALVVPLTQPSCNSNGDLSINQNTGEITFAPNPNFVGICFVNVSFSDGDGGYTTSEFKVTINNLDLKPTVAESCVRTATEQSAYSCTVTKTDDNYDGTTANDSWHLADSNLNTCDFLSINSSGVLSGTPNNQHVGTCRVAFYFHDGSFASNVKSFNLTISNVIPTLTVTDVTFNEGTAPTGGPLPSPNNNWIIKADSEVNALGESTDYGNGIPPIGTYSLGNTSLNPNCKTVAKSYDIHNRNGQISFEPEQDFAGECYFSVYFDDDKGAAATSQFKVTVTNTNDPPVISSNCTDQSIQEGEVKTCSVNVNDIDNDGIAQIEAIGCTWITINKDTGIATMSPNNTNVGSCSLTIRAQDNGGSYSNVIGPYNITVTNAKPTLNVTNATANENAAPFVILTDANVSSNEEGLGGKYSIEASTQGNDCDDIATLTIDEDSGEITFESDNDHWAGSCYIVVRVDDQNGAANSITDADVQLTVTNVNDAPTINYASCPTSISENVNYTCIPNEVTDHDLLFSNDSLSIVAGPTHTCNWMNIANETGVLTGIPQDNQIGSCVVHIVATDSTGANDEVTYNVTVSNSNPILNIENAVIDENTNAATLIRTNPEVQASDEGFGSYSVQAASVNDCNSPAGAVTVNATNGAVTFTPPAPITADCRINIRFTDTQGAFVNSEFFVYVQTVDNPPTLAATCPATITQGDSYSCGTNPTATDDNISRIIYMTGNEHTCFWATIDPVSGVVSGIPLNNNIGECVMEFRAFDGAFFSNSYTVNVNVANDPPTLVIATPLTFAEDNPTIRDPLSDSDVQASEEGNGTYSISDTVVGGTNCTEIGDVTINTVNGAISFDSPDHYHGTCFIGVIFDDGNATNNTVLFEVELIVNPVNDAPILDLTGCDDTPNQGEAYSCSIATTDPDNEDLVFEFDTGHTCSWMNISPGSGDITGTPANANVETCLLQVKVTDEAAAVTQASRSITVNNTVPTLTIDPVAIPAASASMTVLTNELVQASEEGEGVYSINNAAVTGVNCNDNATGLAIVAGTGRVTMDINNTFTGNCNIGVKFDDLKGGTVTAIVIVTVTNDSSLLPPIITKNDRLSISQGDINITLNTRLKVVDPDHNNSQVIFTLDRAPSYGSLKVDGTIINATETFTLADLNSGDLTYHHSGVYHTSDSFEFSVSDGVSEITETVFNIDILDKREARPDLASTVFASNGEALTDLTSNNKAFYQAGYIGDAISVNNTSGTKINDGYFSWPATESNYSLEVNLGGDSDFASDAFTIHFYMKTDATVDSFIMATRNYSYDNTGSFGWGFKLLADGKIRFSSHDAVETVTYDSTISVNDDKWHAITINRSGNLLRMYIDGVFNGDEVNVSTIDIEAEDILIIGSGKEFGIPNGLKALDEIRIYRGDSGFTDNHFTFTCPQHYVMVPGSLNSGHASPFCVAKYEMKQVDTSTPISKPDEEPWATVTQADAVTHCQSLGTGYNLVTNEQWMTMAHNIEGVAANWSNGVFTSTAVATELNRGNAFGGGSAFEANSDDAQFCQSMASCSTDTGWDQQKRTHIFSNGQIIWDLSGNVPEHVVDYVNTDKPGAGTPDDVSFDVNEATPTNALTASQFQPLTSTQLSTEDHGIGTYLPGNNNVGGTPLRGGGHELLDSEPAAGLFYLDLRNATSQQAGFRCIFLTN